MVTPTKDSDCFLWVFCSRLLDRALYVVLTSLLGGTIFIFALLRSWKSIVWRYSCN